jgi:hypothetical protein
MGENMILEVALLHHCYEPFPVVEHYEDITS